MARVLAVAPGGTARESLVRLRRELSGHDVTIVDSSAGALSHIEDGAPDLVVFPIALTSSERSPLVAKLRELSNGDDAQCRLFDALTEDQDETAADARWFYWFKPKPEPVVESAKDRAVRQVASVFQRAGGTLRIAKSALGRAATAARAGGRRLGTGALGVVKRTVPIGKAAVQQGKAAAQRGKGAIARAGRGTTPAASAVVAWVRAAREPLLRWMPRAAVVGVLIAAGVTGRAYWMSARPKLTGLTAVITREPKAQPAAAPAPAASTTPAASGPRTGTLHVTSDPPGAAVLLGGRQRGVTPMTIEGLSVGTHTIVLSSDAGTVRRSVVVKADEATTLEAGIFSGWLALFSPIEIQVSEQGRLVRLDEQSQVMLPPGRHELLFTNAALGYREARTVDIQPGETSRISILPRSTLTVTATPGAVVWVDGARIGDAPVTDMPIEIGTREVLVRHPELGERRITITATTTPARVDVDLTAPQP